MNRQRSLLVWLAMLWAMVAYYVVMRMIHAPEAPGGETLANVLLVASASLVVLSILIRSRFLVAVVLCDAAAVLGLVSWCLTGRPRSYYCLVAGILGMVVHYPRSTRAE